MAVINGSNGNDSLNGTSSADTITARAGNDKLYGANGNDTLFGGNGNDSLYGGNQNDKLYGENDNDSLYGGNGNDSLYGGNQNDKLYGENDNDSLYGGNGNDSLYGGNGIDTLLGENDNDSLYGGSGNDSADGGAGGDSLFGDSGNDSLQGGNGNDFLDGGTDNDILDGGNDNDTLFGADGNDVLRGGASTGGFGGNDTLDGGNGNDTLLGYFGNDSLFGGNGNDRVEGGNGNDFLQGNNNNDSLIGGDNNDRLYGGNDTDRLDGSSGNDSLFGDDGSDSLLAGAGNDTLDGGNGSDTAVFSGPSTEYVASVVGGNLVITDTVTTGSDDGTDTIIGVESLNFTDSLLPENLITLGGPDRTISDYDPEDGDQLVFLGIDPSAVTIDYIKGESDRFVTATVLEVAGGPTITLDGVYIPTYSQGFERSVGGWLDEDNTGGGYEGAIERVASGTNGITAFDGNYFAIVSDTDIGNGPSGPFTRFDGYNNEWSGDWTASVKVYLDTDWAAGEGFDYSVASQDPTNESAFDYFRRDFIFHATKDTSTGQLLVGASNNTSFDPDENLELGPHFTVTVDGWYTFEHHFYDNGGVLACDMNLKTGNETITLLTVTLSDPSDLIATVTGQNRYGWFTNVDIAGGLAIDNVSLRLDDPGFAFV